MKSRTVILAVAAFAAMSADAAVARKMPAVTVVEGETLSFDSLKATSLRSSNAAVFTAALRESGEAIVSGTRLGEAKLDYVDERGVFATREVMVVPPYWGLLNKMFADDPEVTISIVGDKIVVGGATANVDTLKRAEVDAVKLDSNRVVNQVAYSTAQIGELVKDFLARAGATNSIAVKVVGREVCLSGRMYDQQSMERLKKRVEVFVKDFPGVSVNIDDLKIFKQKILINIEFVAYNDEMSRNLGFSGPEAITAGLDWNLGFTHGDTYKDTQTRTANGTGTSTGTETSDSAATPTTTTKTENKGESILKNSLARTTEVTRDWKGAANVKVSGVQATINLLKKNGAAKKVYATTLSTQSGIEAEFQNGGTIHRSMQGGMGANGSMESVEYGYIVKTTPFIVDDSTVNLEFSLDNKNIKNITQTDIDVERYQTKSKYLVRPGESIILSGYKYNSEGEDKKGTPWLSQIPWIGPYLFGNTQTTVKMNEMLLVVTVSWMVEGDSAAKRLDEMKNREIDVEMP